MEFALEVNGLRKKYGTFSLKNVTFALPRGYIMGLIGPNGAGKTTIIKLIMNLIRREGGDIRLFGMDTVEREAEIKARIGFVYDVPAFYQDITLREISLAIAPFYVKWDDALFCNLVERFELPLAKKFKKLSQGMKTKFALTLALSHDADLILMDEPTTDLDPVFRRDLLGQLRSIMEDEGKSILFSTHITRDLERIADYITLIQDGAVLFSSPTDDILSHWAVVKGSEELLPVDRISSIEGVRRGTYGTEMLISDVEAERGHLPEGVVIERASLEEIMVFKKGEQRHAS